MDYSPINIAPKGKKQGDYYTTTIGPYDYWAIEYAYKPVDGDEAAELKKIAARAPEHDLVYATDEDAFLNDDPYVNRCDLGCGPLPVRQGADRAGVRAAQGPGRAAWSRTATRGHGPGARSASCSSQWGDGATLASQYVGGQSVSRDHKADKDARDPIVPGAGAKQRECLKFLADDDPQRQGVPVLAGLAPPAGSRAVDALGQRQLRSGRASISRCSSGSWASRRSCWATA